MPVLVAKTFSRKLERLSAASLRSLPALVGADDDDDAPSRRPPAEPTAENAPEEAKGVGGKGVATEAMSYRELQAMAKERGIPANQKADALRAALSFAHGAQGPAKSAKKAVGLSERAQNVEAPVAQGKTTRTSKTSAPAVQTKRTTRRSRSIEQATAPEEPSKPEVAAAVALETIASQPNESALAVVVIPAMANVTVTAPPTSEVKTEENANANSKPVEPATTTTTVEVTKPKTPAKDLEHREEQKPSRTLSAKKRRLERTITVVKQAEELLADQERMIEALKSLRARRQAVMDNLVM